MPDDHLSRNVFAIVNAVGIAVAAGYLTAEYVLPYIQRRFFLPNALSKRLQLKAPIQLNQYEAELAENVVHPTEIATGFADIAGNDAVILTIQKNLASITTTQAVLSHRLRAPMGILLYGPPGCGKTLMARAIAKEAGLRFLALPLSTVLDKWVGETEKYLDGLFSLARKIQPCIIFIDEIDALTRRRSMLDRDWNVTMKSQFLSMWDGLLSEKLNAKIIVIGATNRKTDIDEAFLRRMPLQIKISLPDWSQRVQILQLLLDKTTALQKDFDFGLIADQTEGWSGSDLKELCRRVELDHYYHGIEEPLDEDAFSPKITEMLREFADAYERTEETIIP